MTRNDKIKIAFGVGGALVLGGLIGSALKKPKALPPPVVAPPAPSAPAPNIDARILMRKLWSDHVAWTHAVIVSNLDVLPDLAENVARLLRNQTEIGNAIRPAIGNAAGDKLTQLLRDHIMAAISAVNAAKQGTTSQIKTTQDALYKNADDIAAFLASTGRWPLATLQSMMKTHIDQLLAEVTARLKKDWPADVAATDASTSHILQLADALAAAL
jgi:hypothetical protein